MSFLNLDISLIHCKLLSLTVYIHISFFKIWCETWRAYCGLWPVYGCQDFLVCFFLSQLGRFKRLKRKSFVALRRFCFLKFLDHSACSRGTLDALVIKWRQPRSNSISSLIIALINTRSSQPHSLKFNLSWLYFSISFPNPWSSIVMKSYWNSL